MLITINEASLYKLIDDLVVIYRRYAWFLLKICLRCSQLRTGNNSLSSSSQSCVCRVRRCSHSSHRASEGEKMWSQCDLAWPAVPDGLVWVFPQTANPLGFFTHNSRSSLHTSSAADGGGHRRATWLWREEQYAVIVVSRKAFQNPHIEPRHRKSPFNVQKANEWLHLTHMPQFNDNYELIHGVIKAQSRLYWDHISKHAALFLLDQIRCRYSDTMHFTVL